MSIAISKGSGVTAPFSSSRPAFGSFSDTAKGAGPAAGQLTSLTSADRSVTTSVVSGLTASSRKMNPPLRSVTCSTFSFKPFSARWPVKRFRSTSSMVMVRPVSLGTWLTRTWRTTSGRTARTSAPTTTSAARPTTRILRARPLTRNIRPPRASARALVPGARHAAAQGISLPRLLDRNTTNVEEAPEDQIRPGADLECLAGAFHLDQRHLLEHGPGLLPLGSTQVEGATREQHGRYQRDLGSHGVSSHRSLEDTRNLSGGQTPADRAIRPLS